MAWLLSSTWSIIMPVFGDQCLWFYDRFTNADPNNSLYFTDEDWAGGQVFAFWNEHVRQFLIDNAVFFLKRVSDRRYPL